MALPEMKTNPGFHDSGFSPTSARFRRWPAPLLIVVVGLALYLPGLGWGLPATVSWSQDTIAGRRTLGPVWGWPDRWDGRYAPLQYFILAGAYQPVLRHWDRTGERSVEPATGRPALEPPHAPKIGVLIGIARVVSVVMAITASLGLWAAARRLTGDDLAALLAAFAWMIGAAYTYFAHLGNVDIPSVCWFTWSLYFFTRLLRSRRWGDALLLGLFGSAAIGTKDALAGMYPGMALVLLVSEARHRLEHTRPAPAVLGAIFQPRWFLGLAAFVLPYLFLYGVFSAPGGFDAYLDRLRYWLDPGFGSLHARQHRYSSQLHLLLATIHYAAGAVGWPMLAAMAASVWYTLRAHRNTALIMLVPALGYYLIVIAQIDFVYSRFLFAPMAAVCVLVGLAAAAMWRKTNWPGTVRIGVSGVVLLLSLGYAVAINAEMVTDSRYRAEKWFNDNVPRSENVGAFSNPQYLPRLPESGYATYQVEMARESFDRPQPEYLILTSYNYEDFNEAQQACMRELLGARLGYTPVVAFGGRYLGASSSWLSLAGWGTPTPGKISPRITILRRTAS